MKKRKKKPAHDTGEGRPTRRKANKKIICGDNPRTNWPESLRERGGRQKKSFSHPSLSFSFSLSLTHTNTRPTFFFFLCRARGDCKCHTIRCLLSVLRHESVKCFDGVWMKFCAPAAAEGAEGAEGARGSGGREREREGERERGGEKRRALSTGGALQLFSTWTAPFFFFLAGFPAALAGETLD